MDRVGPYNGYVDEKRKTYRSDGFTLYGRRQRVHVLQNMKRSTGLKLGLG